MAKVPSDRKREVWRRDNYRCRYCKAPVCNPSEDAPPHLWATVDHVRPRSKGGKNDKRNLVTACQRCNGAKADKPASKFIADDARVNLSVGAALKFGYRFPQARKEIS
jgi:5-methylcytosine-specific restriction endonuclease McrA